MTTPAPAKRLGFFTRLLDEVSAAERYRFATEQILHAERFGFDSAWVAQHHFHEAEGGLPAPLVFLAQVAALTSRIRLGTGIITLPLEHGESVEIGFAFLPPEQLSPAAKRFIAYLKDSLPFLTE